MTIRKKNRKYVDNKNNLGPRDELLKPLTGNQQRQFRFEIIVVLAVLAFCIYESVLYFGHQVVPNTDFTAFVKTGRDILNFRLPYSFKRAPGLGMLQILLSHLVGGYHPVLTAGWLLNAILHPFNVLLFYLIGKRFIGKAAIWPALIFSLNPWVLSMLVQPLVETALLFFILLTFYLILKRSKWCYLFAAMCTMMRYEGAGLIFVAFVYDMLDSPTLRKRLLSLLYSALASVPLALWMLGTYLHWDTEGKGSHYLKHFNPSVPSSWSFFHINLLNVSVGRLLILPDAKLNTIIFWSLGILAAISLLAALIYSLYKKKWEAPILLLFLAAYYFVHAPRPNAHERYAIPVAWLILILSLYGLKTIWKRLERFLSNTERKHRMMVGIKITGQILLLIISVIWLMSLVRYLPQYSEVSKKSVLLPHIAAGVVAVIFIVKRFSYRRRYILRDLAISAFVCLIIISNQFGLVRRLGNGDMSLEFKKLAYWYVENTEKNEKLVSAGYNLLGIYAPKYKKNFVHLGSIKAENPTEFVKKCYKRNITYITWDSLGGRKVGGVYYRRWGFKNIAMLAQPRDIGPYEYVDRVSSGPNYINIFRLKNLQELRQQAIEKQKQNNEKE